MATNVYADSRDIIKQLFANKEKTALPPQYLSDQSKVYFMGDQNVPWANNFPDLATARRYGAAEQQVKGYNPTPAGYESQEYGWVPATPGTPEAESYIRGQKAGQLQKATQAATPAPTPVATPAPTSGITELQNRLLKMGQGLYDTSMKPFTYSSNVNELMSRIAGFNPQEFAQWANQPVNWTEADIRNQYGPALSDLERQRQLATKELLAELQSRGLGRAGIVETSLGDLGAEYARQESNMMATILADLLKSGEELTQSRRALGLQGFGTAADLAGKLGGIETAGAGITQIGQKTAADMLGQMMGTGTAERGLDIQETLGNKNIALEDKKIEIDRLLQNRDLDIKDKLAELQKTMTNASIDNDTKRLVMQKTQVENEQLNNDAQIALSRGNLKLAEQIQKDAMAVQKFYQDMASKQQEFTQATTQQQLKQNLLNTLVDVYGIETQDASKIIELINRILGQLAA